MKHAGMIVVLSVLPVFLAGMMILYTCASTPERRDPGASFSAPKLRGTIPQLEPLHEKLGRPRAGDWLAEHREAGQTFAAYIGSHPVTPRQDRRKIYLLPIGAFSPAQEKILDTTADFMKVYYRLPVVMMETVDDRSIPARARRTHPSWGMPQILTSYILYKILLPRLPEDGMVIFGITAVDLWPGKGWNFVYGQASLRDRVCVQSIYRNGDPHKGADARLLFLRRTLKTATHEMGHVLSMHHCTAWDCNMCGSNHRRESDRHPLWMCPECMAKLCWAVSCDPGARYRDLHRFCAEHGLKDAAAFYRTSCRRLGVAVDGPDDHESEEAKEAEQ